MTRTQGLLLGIGIGIVLPAAVMLGCVAYLYPHTDLTIWQRVWHLRSVPEVLSKVMVAGLLPNALAAMLSYKLWAWNVHKGIVLMTILLLVPAVYFLA